MRRESASDRAAWTAAVTGDKPAKKSKYGAVRTDGYASKHEAEVAANFKMLAATGVITDYKEQERIVIVPGKGKIRPVIYVADFTFIESGKRRVLDAKGYRKIPVYVLKKKLLKLLHNIDIEEV